MLVQTCVLADKQLTAALNPDGAAVVTESLHTMSLDLAENAARSPVMTLCSQHC